MPKLYLVPTPIGNLEDITLRAIRILKEVDGILAEDTRTSGNLLRHLDISKPMTAFHIRNEHQVVERIADRIEAGETLALVTDAGTPAISAPGFLLDWILTEWDTPVTDAYANIVIDGSTTSVYVDEDGRFTLSDLTAGTHTFRFSTTYVAYTTSNNATNYVPYRTGMYSEYVVS